MSINNPEYKEKAPLLEEKIAVHTNFIKSLNLDIDKDGSSVAGLIETMIEKYPDIWEEEIEKIVQKAKKLEQTDSLQTAMFYLGDIINSIDLEKTKELHRDDPERKVEMLRLGEGLTKMIREAWAPEYRAMAGELDNIFVPDWWDEIEMQSDKYIAFMKRLKSGEVFEEINKIINKK